MFVALGPGKFYGSSLPRPRFYTDLKFNSDRVDPPSPVMAPLLAWAQDAHWSMGGLSFQRTRLQGRIEGSVKRLRAQQEDRARMSPTPPKPKKTTVTAEKSPSIESEDDRDGEEVAVKESTLAELFRGRKGVQVAGSFLDGSINRRKRVRKLGDEFDRIAAETGMDMACEEVGAISARTRSRKAVALETEGTPAKDAAAAARRVSPRKKTSD